jgi:DNA-binding LytR/AlgR family response regulator
MQKFSCLIVDDEPIAREIIRTYCGHLEHLVVAGMCGSALEAKSFLQLHKVDILFLDINMPLMDGISFLKTLRKQPEVIFTTAYREYAVDAFELSAVDYLLKPFSLERFIIAVDKAVEKLHPVQSFTPERTEKGEDFTFLKIGDRIFKILFEDLLYAEASGNNVRIVTSGQTFSPNMTFTNLEELLPKATFLRVHRSFLINKSKISHIEGNRVFIDQAEIPIGSSYRERFMKEIGIG